MISGCRTIRKRGPREKKIEFAGSINLDHGNQHLIFGGFVRTPKEPLKRDCLRISEGY